MNKYIHTLIISVLLFTSCQKEETLSPYGGDIDRLEELIDNSFGFIKEFKEKYDSYILYEFDHMKDFAYQFDKASNWRDAEIKYLEKVDVPGALDFLKQNFIKFYNDTITLPDSTVAITNFKKNFFPRKLLICKELLAKSLGITNTTYFIAHDATASMNSFTVSRLDSTSLAEMPESEIERFRKNINYMFIAGYVWDAKRIDFLPKSFYEYSKSYYRTPTPEPDDEGEINPNYYWSKGFFPPEENSNFFPSLNNDVIEYIKQLIFMDQSTAENIKRRYPVVKAKIKEMAESLKKLGVDIMALNPNLSYVD